MHSDRRSRTGSFITRGEHTTGPKQSRVDLFGELPQFPVVRLPGELAQRHPHLPRDVFNEDEDERLPKNPLV